MVNSILHRSLLSRRATAASSSQLHANALLFSFLFSPIPTPRSHSPYSSTTLINHTTTNTNDTTNLTVSYLVASCGLSPAAAASAASKIHIKSTARADAVLALLKRYGFSDVQISKIAMYFPNLLTFHPDKILIPKLDFFLRLGFSGPALAKIITREPSLLARSLEGHLVPCLDFVHEILGTAENVVATFVHAPFALNGNLEKQLRPSISALRAHGLSPQAISRLVKIEPGVLVQGPERIDEVIGAVKAVGLSPADSMFVYAASAYSGMKTPTFQKKIAAFRSFGFSEEEFFSAFRRQPLFMTMSERKIRAGLQCLIERLGLSPADVIAYPLLLMRSVDKTVLPRFAVLHVLRREGKIGEDARLIQALHLNKKRFLEKYVSRYQDDVPDVLKAYNGEIDIEGLVR